MTGTTNRIVEIEPAERGLCPRCACLFELDERGLVPPHFGCIKQPQPPYQEPTGACVKCGRDVQYRLSIGGRGLVTDLHRGCVGGTIRPART
jgi:hypothetical protein